MCDADDLGGRGGGRYRGHQQWPPRAWRAAAEVAVAEGDATLGEGEEGDKHSHLGIGERWGAAGEGSRQ